MTSRVWSIDIDGKPFISRQSGPRQFRCVFDVEISPGDALSLADIRIYNLSKESSVNRRSSILLRAGNDARSDVIFMGYVTNVFRERDPGSTDIALRLICKSGTPTADRSSIQKSFGRGTSVVDVLRSLAETWPLPLDLDAAQFINDQVLVSGFILDGDIPAALDKLAYAYGFQWIQELGRLVITKTGMDRPEAISKMISQFTGMIGMPEVTRGPNGLGVFVSVSLDPFVRINGKIEVKSEFSTFNTGNLFIQELSGDATANGVYNVFSLRHRGDTHGSTWSTDIDGIRAGTEFVAPSVENGALVWGARVSEEFRNKVRSVCKNLNIDPNWLMAVMGFETGYTFSPSTKNPGSSATGLIQFMAATARGLGTTTAQLSRMTAVEQLDWVEKYFSDQSRRISNLGDCYMAVLWPIGVGRPDSYVMWERDSGPYQRQYADNSGLDINNDGKITRGEAVSRVNTAFMNGKNFAR